MKYDPIQVAYIFGLFDENDMKIEKIEALLLTDT
jgi:hypothetical protein